MRARSGVRSVRIVAKLNDGAERSPDLPDATSELSEDQPTDCEHAELAQRVVSEGLSRAKTVEAVHRSPGRSVKGKSQARKVTSRTFKVDGYRIVVENKRGVDPKTLADALEAAAGELRAETEGSNS